MSAPGFIRVPSDDVGKRMAARTRVQDGETVYDSVSTLASLTARLLNKIIDPDHRMWVDPAATTNLGAGVIMAEAPEGSAENAAVWNGVFIPTAAGQWVERLAFRWDQRLSGW